MLMFLALLSAAAPAAGPALSSHDPQTVAAYLQAEGYRAKLEASDDKDPTVGPSILTSDGGTKFNINFLSCKAKKQCNDIIFTSSWDFDDGEGPSSTSMHRWNADRRFTKAYLDKEGDPVLEMDVLFVDGKLDRAAFGANLDIYTSALQVFEGVLDEERKEGEPVGSGTTASH
jgi:hypothetical protein